jgi:preprotein translocase subunit SecF
MSNINRATKLQILTLVVLVGLVIFKYHFLWPIALLMIIGSLSSRVSK